LGATFIAQAEFIQRQFPKLIGIADAALRPIDDFLGDKSRRRIVTNQVAQVNVSLSKSVCDHKAGRLEQIFGKTA
jgi:hypothetical protein